ncbi:DNA glycosylase [Naviculisporaceae sp. PSN 640]
MPPTTRSSARTTSKQPTRAVRVARVKPRREPHVHDETPLCQEESHYFENTDPAKVTTRGRQRIPSNAKKRASSKDDPENHERAPGSKKRRVEIRSTSGSGPGAGAGRVVSPLVDDDLDGGDKNEDDNAASEVNPEDGSREEEEENEIVALPVRRDDTHGHSPSYHHPLLLNNINARQALLTWFDSVTSNRNMPWRKPWIDPSKHSDNNENIRELLKQRAYEVWISEVMLQQTRVATVIDYWTRWMARWPTIDDLAAAEPQDVLDQWSGLGYYSRATRVHNAARTICAEDGDYDGLLPDDPATLEAEMDGVGKYTAGAIAAIVFGKAVPLVDGNVLRVLTRQMGLFGDVQKDKKVADKIWDAARRLARQVVRDELTEELEEDEDAVNFGLPLSDKPGQWGQALMELGSTICTPKPKCAKCPVTSTCRAYSEGYAQAIDARAAPGRVVVPPTASEEDANLCTLCLGSPLEIEQPGLNPSSGTPTTGKKTSPFFNAPNQPLDDRVLQLSDEPTPLGLEIITRHAAKYPPKRTPKKQLPHHESRVIALRRSSDGRYLIQRRPATGLLANMWELPSRDGPAQPSTGQPYQPKRRPWPEPESEPERKKKKKRDGLHVTAGLGREGEERGRDICRTIIMESELVIPPAKNSEVGKIMHRMRWVGELGIVPWTFSHMRLTMYVDLFELFDDQPPEIKWKDEGKSQRWATREEIEGLTMGSGMRKCWGLVKQAEEEGW